MTKRLFTARRDQRVVEVVKGLLKHRISGAPVVDDARRVVGVISEQDCIKALMRAVHHRVPFSLVGEVMSTQVISISEDTHIMTMADLFLAHPVRRLPVVRDGILVGQVSRRDVLTTAVSLFKGMPTRQAAVLYLSALGRQAPV
jgi:predicted transcriptional regulator